jgi:hypothetical protein
MKSAPAGVKSLAKACLIRLVSVFSMRLFPIKEMNERVLENKKL